MPEDPKEQTLVQRPPTPTMDDHHQHNHHRQTDNGRPVSFYDNFAEASPAVRAKFCDAAAAPAALEIASHNGSPTQAHCLMTTVPQNIVAQSIANKHTPTRTSLRHSRMIAMNKTGRVPRKYLPAIIRYHKLAKALLGLLTLVGLAMCFLSLWLVVWTPNIRQRDNPYWSAIPVFISGTVGLVLLCCCRKEYPGMKRSYLVYSIKVLSITISSVAAVAAFTGGAFALIHLFTLYSMTCSPPDQLDTTCVCRMDGNSTVLFPIKTYHYVDLSCPEVDNILTILMMFSLGTNLLAGILEVWYVYLHWASRYVYTYSKVRTNEHNNTEIFTNTR